MNKRILSLVPTRSLEGGGEKSFFEVLCYLQSHGYNNYVVIPRDSEGSLKSSLTDKNIEYIVGSFDSFGLYGNRSIDELKQVLDISEIIKKITPDVCMTNLYVEPSQWAAAICGIPHIYFDRGQLGLLANRGELPKTPPDYTNYANAIVCNSKNGQNILKERYGIQSDLVYSYVEPPTHILEKGDKPRIIVPANFFREKNHLDILAAINKIIKEDPHFSTPVILMGSVVNKGNEEYLNEIREYISRHNLGGIVECVGYIKEPWKFFTDKDIYINAGEGEAVGRATAEAEMLGLTTVISDIPGHWEHVNLFGNQFSFRLHDTSDLASKIRFVLDGSNKLLVSTHNKEVKQKIREWMTPDVTMGQIVSVIEKVTQEKNPAEIKVLSDVRAILDNVNNEIADLKNLVEHTGQQAEELELLRRPGIKLATRKLAGSIKRRIRL